jgi:hypothetical protein
MTDAPVSTPQTAPQSPPTGALSVSEAAGFLSKRREEAAAPEPKQARAPVAEPETVEQPEGAPVDESGEEPGDAPPEQEPSVDTEEGEDDRAGEPPIDPPRSLSKEDREIFKSLPRESQQRWATLARSQELEVRRIQNEAAESRKAAEAAQKAATEARQRYEERLPAIAHMLQGEIAQKFGDIRSMDDVVRLAQTNPARHGEFQALVQRAQTVAAEQQHAEANRQAQADRWFESFTAEEDRKFLEAAPEFGDPKKGDQLRREAAELLMGKGFTEAEINDLWAGKKPALVRDHRFQLIIRDAMRYEAAKKAVPAARTAPQQPSVRAGVPKAKGEARQAAVQELSQKLSRTGKVDDAVALLRARRAAN